jgi:hypothetical protein
MKHKLKSWPANFKKLSEEQFFDVRKNDRNFQVGDELLFEEYDPNLNMGEVRGHTGKKIEATITFICSLDQVPLLIEKYSLGSDEYVLLCFYRQHPMIKKLADAMQAQLAVHAGKGRPEDFALLPEQVMDRLWENVHELGRAIKDLNNPLKPGITPDAVLVKAADVANYAMFCVHAAGGGKGQ